MWRGVSPRAGADVARGEPADGQVRPAGLSPDIQKCAQPARHAGVHASSRLRAAGPAACGRFYCPQAAWVGCAALPAREAPIEIPSRTRPQTSACAGLPRGPHYPRATLPAGYTERTTAPPLTRVRRGYRAGSVTTDPFHSYSTTRPRLALPGRPTRTLRSPSHAPPTRPEHACRQGATRSEASRSAASARPPCGAVYARSMRVERHAALLSGGSLARCRASRGARRGTRRRRAA